jgi:hypothetical protein
MTTSRLPRRRGDGSAVVDGWVAVYTLGLPAPMRARRREELSGFLADERADAVRRGEVGTLRRRRLIRWFLGIPDDLLWRLTDARAVARAYPRPAWVPLTRWSGFLLVCVGLGAVAAFVLVAQLLVDGSVAETDWAMPGPLGFLASCLAIAIGTGVAIPWPRAGAVVTTLGALIGFAVAPWLWGCWGLAVIAVVLRLVQADRLQPTR